MKLYKMTTLCLAAINIHSMAFAVKAEDILSETESYLNVGDVRIRKGSIAATIANTRAINQWLATKDAKIEELQKILLDQRELLPALHITGMFDLFVLDEWLVPSQGEGRCWVGILYLQEHPEKMTPALAQLLKQQAPSYSPALRKEIQTSKLMEEI